MDVIGWSLLTLPDGAEVRPDSGTEWYSVPSPWLTVTRSPRNCTNQPESEALTYTTLSGADGQLSSSEESLHDWERLSDSDKCDGEEHCQSLPDCGNHGNNHRLERSNTVWYARLDRNADNKDFTFKNKFISAWTNVTNGWVLKTATSFKIDSQICLLGRKYTCDTHSPAKSKKVKFAEFKEDFASRIWLTYRMDFSILPRSQLSSDVGWGCMLRSGQMILAQAFILHFINRDSMLASDDASRPQHRKIIRYFGDFFSDDCPFSIHKLVEISHSLGRQTGDWFGPASICVVLRDALDQVKSGGHSELSQLVIYLTMDCTVYKQDVIDLCSETGTSSLEQHGTSHPEPLSAEASSSTGDSWQSLIILMPLRLGSETLNAIYIPCMKKILESDLCIGIIGGRPKHSLYFIGWQDDRLIYLDPHCCQKTVNILEEVFPTETFHCAFPRKLPFRKMDPTCAIGFYCKTRQDFERLVKDIPQMIAQPLLENSPLFSFQEGRRADVEKGCLCSMDTFRQMKGDDT